MIRYKDGIRKNLEVASIQLNMLKRINDGHVNASVDQVSEILKKLSTTISDAHRLVDLS